MRPVIDSDSEPVYQLTAQPTRPEDNYHSDERQNKRAVGRYRRVCAAQEPTDREEDQHEYVAAAMQ